MIRICLTVRFSTLTFVNNIFYLMRCTPSVLQIIQFILCKRKYTYDVLLWFHRHPAAAFQMNVIFYPKTLEKTKARNMLLNFVVSGILRGGFVGNKGQRTRLLHKTHDIYTPSPEIHQSSSPAFSKNSHLLLFT